MDNRYCRVLEVEIADFHCKYAIAQRLLHHNEQTIAMHIFKIKRFFLSHSLKPLRCFRLLNWHSSRWIRVFKNLFLIFELVSRLSTIYTRFH